MTSLFIQSVSLDLVEKGTLITPLGQIVPELFFYFTVINSKIVVTMGGHLEF